MYISNNYQSRQIYISRDVQSCIKLRIILFLRTKKGILYFF